MINEKKLKIEIYRRSFNQKSYNKEMSQLSKKEIEKEIELILTWSEKNSQQIKITVRDNRTATSSGSANLGKNEKDLQHQIIYLALDYAGINITRDELLAKVDVVSKKFAEMAQFSSGANIKAIQFSCDLLNQSVEDIKQRQFVCC